jgi:hypothetical protein
MSGRHREPGAPAVTVEGPPAVSHDVGMDRRATAIASTAVLLVAVALVVQPGCARHEGEGPPLGPGGVLAAEPAVQTSCTSRQVAGDDAWPGAARLTRVSGEDRLEAVCTVERFCDLVGSHRRGQAQELLGAPGLLRARELRRAQGIEFVSARVAAHPRAGTVTVAASVRTGARSEPTPRKGADTLFFTLGRVGTTTGGWLITAVTTSP